MQTVVTLTTAVLCWLNALYKLAEVYRSRWRNLPAASLLVALVTMAMALTLQVPSVNIAFDQLSGVAQVSQVLGQILVLSSMTGFQALIYLSAPRADVRRLRWRLYLLTATVVILSALFLVSPTRHPAVLSHLLSAAGYGAVYLCVYCGYMAFSSADIIRLAHRLARVTEPDLVRIGLRMMTTGGLFGLVYAMTKVFFTVVRTFFVPALAPMEFAVIVPLITLGPLFLVVGATIPSWGPWFGLDRPVRWFGYYRLHRHLYPLWSMLYRSVGPATLDQISASAWADRWVVRNLRECVYRRYIEIQDALLVLSPYRSAGATQRAAALVAADHTDDEHRDAVIEAATIAAAVDAKYEGATPDVGQATVNPAGKTTAAGTSLTGDELPSDVARTQLVAMSLNSGIVRRVRQEEAARRKTVRPSLT